MDKKSKTKISKNEITVFSDENKDEEVILIMDEKALEEFEKDAKILQTFEF